jgi:hypothetical protein
MFLLVTVWEAVVVTVIVDEVVEDVPEAAMDAGLKLHVVSEGRPEHAREIVPVRPLEWATCT